MGPGARLLWRLLQATVSRKGADKMVSYTQSRQFFPVVWGRANVPAGANLQIGMVGQGAQKEFPAARKSDVVTLVLVLSATPSAGNVTATITKDGVDTAFSAQCGAATSTSRRIIEIPPGALQFNKNHRIGIHLTSSALLSPLTLEAAVYIEVQPTI